MICIYRRHPDKEQDWNESWSEWDQICLTTSASSPARTVFGSYLGVNVQSVGVCTLSLSKTFIFILMSNGFSNLESEQSKKVEREEPLITDYKSILWHERT